MAKKKAGKNFLYLPEIYPLLSTSFLISKMTRHNITVLLAYDNKIN